MSKPIVSALNGNESLIKFFNYECNLGQKDLTVTYNSEGVPTFLPNRYYISWKFTCENPNINDVIEILEATCSCTADVSVSSYSPIPGTNLYLGEITGIFTAPPETGLIERYVYMYLKDGISKYIINELDVEVPNPNKQPLLLKIIVHQK